MNLKHVNTAKTSDYTQKYLRDGHARKLAPAAPLVPHPRKQHFRLPCGHQRKQTRDPRIVIDVIARSDGTSLNNNLLVVPGLFADLPGARMWFLWRLMALMA